MRLILKQEKIGKMSLTIVTAAINLMNLRRCWFLETPLNRNIFLLLSFSIFKTSLFQLFFKCQMEFLCYSTPTWLKILAPLFKLTLIYIWASNLI